MRSSDERVSLADILELQINRHESLRITNMADVGTTMVAAGMGQSLGAMLSIFLDECRYGAEVHLVCTVDLSRKNIALYATAPGNLLVLIREDPTL